MPLIWLLGYNIREGKVGAYRKFIGSKEFRKICERMKEETGIKYLETYMTVIPSSNEEGDYDCYDLWELPNHASLDRIRKSEAMGELAAKTYSLIHPRPSMSRTLRRVKDVKIMFEPKEGK